MKALFALFPGWFFVLSFVAPNAFGAAEAPFAGGKWIDLTHEFSSETLYWPTAEKFALESEFRGQTPQGYFYAANRYRASEHGGTHIDAPVHFAEGHQTVDQLPMKIKGGSGGPLRIVSWVAEKR